MENKKLKELTVRTVSGVVMLLLFIGALVLSPWSAAALFGVIMIGGLLEFYNLCRKKGFAPMYSVGIATSVALLVVTFTVFTQWGVPATEMTARLVLGALLYAMLIVPTTFVCELWRKSETPIANIATTFMGVIYVALPMAVLPFIPQLLVGKWSAWAMLAFVSIIWANDVFAYLVGVTCGKHRLCERISPKKSWEGFFGGLLGAVAMGYVAATVLEASVAMWIGVALVAAISGVFGDLVESMMKRSIDIKDSGNIIPGHGGWLDRFDALILSAPFVFVYACIYTLAV